VSLRTDLIRRARSPRNRQLLIVPALLAQSFQISDFLALANIGSLAFRLWRIVLQKSQNAVRLIFRQTTKQAAIVDRCSLKRAAEVACEFVAG